MLLAMTAPGRISSLALLITYFLFVPPAKGQFLSPRLKFESDNPVLTRYIFAAEPMIMHDTVPLVRSSTAVASQNIPGHKSPFLAAALSLVIPGLGEYYVGDHIWRGMIFTGFEAGLWIGMIHWQNEYNTAQNNFYAYSDAHFCVSRYGGHIDSLLITDSATAYAHITPCNWRAIGRSAWDSLNMAEAELDSLSTSNPQLGDWNHRIIYPYDDMQQYYEEISKYDQFTSGWDLLASYNTASSLRAYAQHESDISRNFLFGIFLNHALSAIDAALLARDHNTALELHGSLLLQPYPDGTLGIIPTANIEYRF